jgi:putative flippase GtrA
VLKSSGLLLQMARYVVVGSFNTLASYLVFALCILLGAHYVLATVFAFVLGMLLGFRLHGTYVFDHPGDHRFWHFTFISLMLLGASVGIQTWCRPWANDYLAGAIAVCATIPVSFLLNRAFVFLAPEPPEQNREP